MGLMMTLKPHLKVDSSALMPSPRVLDEEKPPLAPPPLAPRWPGLVFLFWLEEDLNSIVNLFPRIKYGRR
jgi:hypothetical protein